MDAGDLLRPKRVGEQQLSGDESGGHRHGAGLGQARDEADDPMGGPRRGYVKCAGGDPGFQLVHFDGTVDVARRWRCAVWSRVAGIR